MEVFLSFAVLVVLAFAGAEVKPNVPRSTRARLAAEVRR
jgi:hypothetical protein